MSKTSEAWQAGYDRGVRERSEELAANQRLLAQAGMDVARLDFLQALNDRAEYSGKSIMKEGRP
jgi:hypothetical protein